MCVCVTNPKHLSLPGHGWQTGGIRQCCYYYPSYKMGFSDRAPIYKRKEQVCSSPSLAFGEFRTPFLFFLLEIGILIPFAVTAPPPPPPSVRERRGFSTNHKRRRRFHYALCPCHLLPLVRSGGGDFRFEKKGRKCFQTRRRLLCWVGLGRGRADILFYMSLAFCCTSSIMFPHQTVPSPPLFTP